MTETGNSGLQDGPAPEPLFAGLLEDGELPLRAQLRLMSSALRRSGEFRRVMAFAFGLLGVILLTAYGQVALNSWNVPFYNAIERRDLAEFLRQLKVFAVIATALLLLNVAQTWLSQMVSLAMREGVTRDLVEQWLTGRRAIRLSAAGPLGVNPDQRLQEDARVLAEVTASLCIGFVQSGILLASFIGVLWALSSDFAITMDGRILEIPGYMVWAAFLYAGLASLLIRLVGRRLVALNVGHYAAEADFRTALMRTSEHVASISLARGEARERRWIGARLDAVIAALRAIVRAQTRLKWVSAAFGWLAHVAPIIIAAPIYFSGRISFGGLMMAVGAFNHVNAALRWYVDNFGSIATWRAALSRASSFRDALQRMDRALVSTDLILYRQSEDKSLSIDHCRVRSVPGRGGPGGTIGFAEPVVHVAPGERLMITAGSDGARHLMFLALAKFWPWGSGSLTLPPDASLLFLPERPFLPESTLREVLLYPRQATIDQDALLIEALERTALHRLASSLGATARWHRALDEEERARLFVANILVRNPACLVTENLFAGLKPDVVRDLATQLRDHVQGSILYFGECRELAEVLQPRMLELIQD